MSLDLRGPGGSRTLVTARDTHILMLAAKWPFLTAEDVRSRFYGNKKTKNHFTRLKKLTKAGLLDPVAGDNRTRLGFRITPKGVNFLPTEELKSKALAARRRHYRTGFDHDRVLLQVQDVLESSPMVSRFMAENEVRQLLTARHGKQEQPGQGYKIPDGVFTLTTQRVSMTVAIELELSVKKASAYARIFREQLLSPDYQAVLYIVRNAQMKNLLAQILADTRTSDLVVLTASRKNAVYFVVLDEVLEKRTGAVFEAESSSFSLDSLEVN